jgi:hypothetical protein
MTNGLMREREREREREEETSLGSGREDTWPRLLGGVFPVLMITSPD